MTEEFYRWLLQLIREDRLVKFYQSPKWRRLREKAMKRDHYECQECRRLGKYHRVENVHHIKEVKDRPDLALDLDNLICVCIEHHNEVHGRYLTTLDKQEKKIESFANFDASERW
ncbi:HNH endonuclease [Enterococcus pernyi]